ncbi:hypothetical protein CMI37_32185 [Candidatus Pacearchaeota archaeon]|nr:hypothetical protein [Candidatus Pacearchaeota archaeon]
MGHWQGLQTKSGHERNFYVEDGKFYDSIKKQHEYRNCEPYDLIKDNTVKDVPITKTEPIRLAKPEIKEEVKQENAGRFKALLTPAGNEAKKLLSAGKLNHTAFTKALNEGSATLTQKKHCKDQFWEIIRELLDNDIATKKGLNYIYK